MAKYIVQDYTMSAIGDAIRNQTGNTDPLSPADMADEITGTLGNIVGLVDRTLTDIEHRGVTEVAPFAFYKYDTLTSVSFPNCTSIGSSAFNGCTGLTTAWFPECTSVGTSAFTSCTSIQNAALGYETFTSGHPFKAASKTLVNVSIPYCTSISGSAFYSHTNLQTVYAPKATTVNGYAWTGTKISNLTIGLTELLSTNNHRLSTIRATLQEIHCPQCTTIEASIFAAPSSSVVASYPELKIADFPVCTNIGDYAFFRCYALSSINFPVCETIGSSAFFNCQNLSLANLPTCKTIGSGAFGACHTLTYVDAPACTDVGERALNDVLLSYITLGVSEISSNVFCGYSLPSLITLNLSNCSTITEYAFSGCTNLTNLSLLTFTNVDSTAFAGCTNITNITLGCTGLYNANIPPSGCFDVVPVLNLPKCENIYSSALGGYTPLMTIDAPCCLSIGKNALSGCTGLTSASFPMCTYIDGHAFRSCTGLTSASFPMCSHIAYWAFADCTNLVSVDFSSVNQIGFSAFLSCVNLTTVNAPMCSSIYYCAFENCTNLVSMDFPICSSIGRSAFYSCSNLTALRLHYSSVVTLGASVFNNTPMTDSSYTGTFGSVYVPASLVDAYKVASYWSDIADRITAIVE